MVRDRETGVKLGGSGTRGDGLPPMASAPPFQLSSPTSAPFARDAPVAFPARAGRFGGLRPPAEEVTYSFSAVALAPVGMNSPLGALTTLPGAGTRW